MAGRRSQAVPKYATRRHSRRRSHGVEIGELARRLGFELMPWQFDWLDVATEYRVRGEIPYRKTAVCTVPRQSGKSVAVTVLATDRLTRWPDQYGVLTAQTRIAATNRLKHLAKYLRESGIDPDHRFTRGVGNERITLSNGSQIDVISPTAASAHGESIDFAIIDEAWAVNPVVLAGIVPAMVARPRAQLYVISTAGDQNSILLNEMTARARENPQGDIAYVEYSMPDDARIYDRERWPEWMPALGLTTSPASIEAALTVLSMPEAQRAFGNIAITEDNAAAIPAEWWAGSEADLLPAVGLSIAVDVNRSPPGWAISVAWPTETGIHTDLVEHGVGLELSPIPGKIRDLVERFRPAALGLDAAGPGGALLPDLQSLASDYRIPLKSFNGRERSRSDVYFFELLREGSLSHSKMLALEVAVEGAHADEKGEAWFFSRPSSYVDISPLLACSMAVWLAHETETLAPVVAIY